MLTLWLLSTARDLVIQTLQGKGKTYAEFDWASCPACGSRIWSAPNSLAGIHEVCYPCGLLAMLACARDREDIEDYTDRLKLAMEWEENWCPVHDIFWCQSGYCPRRK